MRNSILSENEDISSQHEEIDNKLFYFLLRRLKVIERIIHGGWDDVKPLKTIEYSFEGLPGYGFTSFYSKKEMERSILVLLYENDVTDWIYDMNEMDPERIKIVKTVRKFLNFILSNKK